MTYTMENQILRVQADTSGAELTSILHKATGWELLWQADPAVWNRRSPLLFPYCGVVKDGRFRIGDKEGFGGRHGFARDMEHTFLGQEEDRLRFELRSSAQTLERYPCQFALETIYSLEENRLSCTMRTTNIDKKPIYYSCGFHTGINFPFVPGSDPEDYFFSLEKEEDLTVLKDGSGSINSKILATLRLENGVVPLTKAGLPSKIFQSPTSRYSQITEKRSGNYVRVYHEGAPYLVLWSTPGEEAKLACIEPWHGISDGKDSDGDFTKKDGIIRLEPGEQFDFTQVLEFSMGKDGDRNG